MNQYLITALVDFVLAVFSFRKKGDRAARALAYVLFGAGIWSIELFVLSSLTDSDLVDVLFHITRWGLFLFPPCCALFAWRLVGSRPKTFLNYVVLPAFAFSVFLGVTNLFFYRSELIATDSGYLPEIDFIYYGFVACFAWCFMWSIGISVIRLKSASNRDSQRLKWMLITFLVCFIGGSISLFLMPNDLYLSKYIGSVTNVVSVGLLFYATVQYHLMDFRMAFSVGLSRAILMGFVVWMIYFVTSIIGPVNASLGNFIVFSVIVITMLELYPRVLRWILPNTKKLFVSNSYDFDSTKAEFQAALNESVTLNDLVAVLDHYLFQVLKVSNYSVAIAESERGLSLSSILTENPGRSVIKIAHEDALLSYCEAQKHLVLTDESDAEIRHRLESQSVCLCFAVAYEYKPMALVSIGSPKEYSYYRYDDIRMFEWLKLELGLVLYRIGQLDEMQNQLGDAKKTLSMLGVMNHYHHDIKAPLAIIDGVLSNDIYDKEKQKDIVLKQVERGSRLIATMAGILKGERKRRIQSLSLHEVVKDSLFLFNLSERQIAFSFSENIPDIRGDSEDLKILVINVVKNAMEASRDNALLHISIKTYITDMHVCLAFADTGTGMHQSQLDNLWLDTASSKKYGTGIGLQAIKRIADEHLAEIDVHSELGKGTEFTFKFPLSIVADRENPSRTETIFDSKNDDQDKPTMAG